MTKTGSVPKQTREEFSFWRQSESWGRGQKGTGKGDRLGQNVRDGRGRGEGGWEEVKEAAWIKANVPLGKISKLQDSDLIKG